MPTNNHPLKQPRTLWFFPDHGPSRFLIFVVLFVTQCLVFGLPFFHGFSLWDAVLLGVPTGLLYFPLLCIPARTLKRLAAGLGRLITHDDTWLLVLPSGLMIAGALTMNPWVAGFGLFLLLGLVGVVFVPEVLRHEHQQKREHAITERRRHIALLEANMGIPLLEAPIPCPTCLRQPLPLNAKFCPYCRADLFPVAGGLGEGETKEHHTACICDKCGTRLPDESDYCSECGEMVRMPRPGPVRTAAMPVVPAGTSGARAKRRQPVETEAMPAAPAALLPVKVFSDGTVVCPYCDQNMQRRVGFQGECPRCQHPLWYRDGAVMGKHVNGEAVEMASTTPTANGTALKLGAPRLRLQPPLHPSAVQRPQRSMLEQVADSYRTYPASPLTYSLAQDPATKAKIDALCNVAVPLAVPLPADTHYYRSLSDAGRREGLPTPVTRLTDRDRGEFFQTRTELLLYQGFLTLHEDHCHPDCVAEVKAVIAQARMRYDRYCEAHRDQC